MQQFPRRSTLMLSAEEAGRIPGVPDAWVTVLRQQEQGINGWAQLWQPYQALLPGVYDFL